MRLTNVVFHTNENNTIYFNPKKKEKKSSRHSKYLKMLVKSQQLLYGFGHRVMFVLLYSCQSVLLLVNMILFYMIRHQHFAQIYI